mmetsp:Transcript_27206/g.80240  ORF Transcript_27206/g.80240 Transcript_27206/m.80240 type:complete len:144 (-) Transcript_27206:107-538(-)
MHEACILRPPRGLVPNIVEVQSWYSSRMKKKKDSEDNGDADDEGEGADEGGKTREFKSVFLQRQEKDESITMQKGNWRRDPTKSLLFEAKYLYRVMEVDIEGGGSETRIVTALEHDEGDGVWVIVTKEADKWEHYDRVYIPVG